MDKKLPFSESQGYREPSSEPSSKPPSAPDKPSIFAPQLSVSKYEIVQEELSPLSEDTEEIVDSEIELELEEDTGPEDFKPPTLESITLIIKFITKSRRAYFEHSLCPEELEKIIVAEPKENWEQKENLMLEQLKKTKEDFNEKNFDELITTLSVIALYYNDVLPGFTHLCALLAARTLNLIYNSPFSNSSSDKHNISKLKLLIVLQKSYSKFKLFNKQDKYLEKCRNILNGIKISVLDQTDLFRLSTISIKLTNEHYNFYLGSHIDREVFFEIFEVLFEKIKEIKQRCDHLSMAITNQESKYIKNLEVIKNSLNPQKKGIRLKKPYTLVYNVDGSQSELEDKKSFSSIELESNLQCQKSVLLNLENICDIINQSTFNEDSFIQLIDLGIKVYLIYEKYNDQDACRIIIQLLISLYKETYTVKESWITVLFCAFQVSEPKSHAHKFLLQADRLLDSGITLSSGTLIITIRTYYALTKFFVYKGQLAEATQYLSKGLKYSQQINKKNNWIANGYFQFYQIAYMSYLQSQNPSNLSLCKKNYDLFFTTCNVLNPLDFKNISGRIAQYEQDRKSLQTVLIKSSNQTETSLEDKKVSVYGNESSHSQLNSTLSLPISSEIKLDVFPEIKSREQLKHAIFLFLRSQQRLFNLEKWQPYLSAIELNPVTVIKNAAYYYENEDYTLAEFWILLLIAKLCDENVKNISMLNLANALFMLSGFYGPNNIGSNIEKKYLLKCTIAAYNLMTTPLFEARASKFQTLVWLAKAYQYENWEEVKSYIPHIKNAIEELSGFETKEVFVTFSLLKSLVDKWENNTNIAQFREFNQWITKKFANYLQSSSVIDQNIIKEENPVFNQPKRLEQENSKAIILKAEFRENKIISSTESKKNITEKSSLQNNETKKENTSQKKERNKKKKKKFKKMKLEKNRQQTSASFTLNGIHNLQSEIKNTSSEQTNPIGLKITHQPVILEKKEKDSASNDLENKKEANEIKERATENKELEKDKAHHQEQLSQLSKENQNLFNQLSILKKEKTVSEKKIPQLESDFRKKQGNLTKGIERLKEKLTKVEEERTAITTTLLEAQVQITQLKTQQSENLTIISTLTTEQKKLNSEILQSKHVADTLAEEKNQLQQNFEQLRAENFQQAEKIESLEKENQTLTFSLKNKDLLLGKSKHETQKIQEEVKTLKATLKLEQVAAKLERNNLTLELEELRIAHFKLLKELELEKRRSNESKESAKYHKEKHAKATAIISQLNSKNNYTSLSGSSSQTIPTINLVPIDHSPPIPYAEPYYPNPIYSPWVPETVYVYNPSSEFVLQPIPKSLPSGPSIQVLGQQGEQKPLNLIQNRQSSYYPGFQYSGAVNVPTTTATTSIPLIQIEQGPEYRI